MSFELTMQDIPYYTYKDYENREGDWELIRGVPYSMSPVPGWRYQSFGSAFLTAFSNSINQLKTHVAASFFINQIGLLRKIQLYGRM